MKQALILCGGKATRLRPYSYAVPKECMPFLNLPLLSLSWFYLEQLGVSRFVLNSHLFPDKLKKTVDFLSQPQQKTDIFFEEEPLGAAGTLYRLKALLQKEGVFFYINGDSLFFPSDRDQLFLFEEGFFKTGVDGSFFVSPVPLQNFDFGALWCDKNLSLKFIGKKNQLPTKFKNLLPYHFSGLAMFKSDLLEELNSDSFCLFEDFINPLLAKKQFKVFVDKESEILEGGEPSAYLKAVNFCLRVLFGSQNKELRKYLLEYFFRFDPEDRLVGFANGKNWSEKLGYPLLAPSSVKGLENLTLKGLAVLGPEVNLFGKSLLKDSVLSSAVSWKGELSNKLILKFFPE